MKTITSKLPKILPSRSMFMASPSSSQLLTLTLYHLNHDHIISILLLLPHDSILSFSLTCKRFNSLTFSNPLWELVCKRDWGDKAVEAFMASLEEKERENLCYRKLYEKICVVSSVFCKRLDCKGADFPKSRASHSLNLVSDWLILFGGGCEGGRHLDDTWAAHIKNRAAPLTWRQVSSGVPGGRFGHSCTQISDDSFILFGGINDSGLRLNDTWHGRLVQDSEFEARIEWKVLEAGGFKPPARGAHSACCVENRAIVVHGGIGLYGLRLGDTWILELSSQEEEEGGQHELTGSTALTASWRQVGTGARSASGPCARSGHSLTWIGGPRTVLFGGRGAGYEVLNDVWLFDFEGFPKWKELKHAHNLFNEMPSPRVGHSATLTLGKKILIYGGEDSERRRKDDFWILDVPTLLTYQSKTGTKNVWKRLSLEGEIAGFRSFHGAAVGVAGRFVYVFGGMVDGFLEPGGTLGLRFDGELYEIGLDLNL